MLNWNLREAGRNDVDALALIGAATFLETFAGVLDGDAIVRHCQKEHSAAAYSACLADGGRAWLAEVTEGGAPVGFALTGKPDLPSRLPSRLPGALPGDVELKRIYTLSRWHGSGLGSALLEAAVKASTAAERLVLGVYAGNARAIAFYTKQGFDPISTRQFNVGGKLYNDRVLAKALNSAAAGKN